MRRPDPQTVLKLEVPLIVSVGERRISLDDVLAFGPGAILELNKSSESELELLVNNKPIGRGEAVKVGENFGVRVLSIATKRQRVEALGNSSASHPAMADE